MARQKKPAQVYDDSTTLKLASIDPSVVARYLKQLSFTVTNKTSKHRKVYQFIKELMIGGLTEKQLQDPLYAALIERIARMTVILDKIERKLFDDLGTMEESVIVDRLGGNYLKYLTEYRSFITSFSDLRWAGDQIQKSKQVETVRQITREEVIEDTTK